MLPGRQAVPRHSHSTHQVALRAQAARADACARTRGDTAAAANGVLDRLLWPQHWWQYLARVNAELQEATQPNNALEKGIPSQASLTDVTKQLLYSVTCSPAACPITRTWVVQRHHLRLPQAVDQPQVALPRAQQQHRPRGPRAGPRQ